MTTIVAPGVHEAVEDPGQGRDIAAGAARSWASSKAYSAPFWLLRSREAIRRRCDSPPDSDGVGSPRRRYPSPTSRTGRSGPRTVA